MPTDFSQVLGARDRSTPKVHVAGLATTEFCDQGQDVMVG